MHQVPLFDYKTELPTTREIADLVKSKGLDGLPSASGARADRRRCGRRRAHGSDRPGDQLSSFQDRTDDPCDRRPRGLLRGWVRHAPRWRHPRTFHGFSPARISSSRRGLRSSLRRKISEQGLFRTGANRRGSVEGASRTVDAILNGLGSIVSCFCQDTRIPEVISPSGGRPDDRSDRPRDRRAKATAPYPRVRGGRGRRRRRLRDHPVSAPQGRQ